MSGSGPAEVPGAGPRRVCERLRAFRLRQDTAGEASVRERSFDKGAEGEERFGRELNAEACRWGGFGVLHSLMLPGESGDIDHVVVGPAGVTVIDSKTWTGSVSATRGKLRVAGRNKQPCIDGMRRQVERVRGVLAEAGHHGVPVSGVLCMVNGNHGVSRAGLEWVQGVGVATPKPVITYAVRGGAAPVEDMSSVHRALNERFRVQGGSMVPSPSVRPLRVAPPAPRRTRRRLSPRGIQAAFGLALTVAAFPVAVSVFRTATDALKPLSQHDLIAHRSEYHALAAHRAHGAVRGPRVIPTATRFRLVYRRGASCRIVITVSRAARLLGSSAPAVRSVGCGAARQRR